MVRLNQSYVFPESSEGLEGEEEDRESYIVEEHHSFHEVSES